MDGIAEKFSAFDFFNHILGGTVFFAALYPLVSDRLTPIETTLITLNQYSSPILIFGIFIFFLAAFTTEMVIDTVSQWFCAQCAQLVKRRKGHSFICPVFDWNRYLMCNCLTDTSIVGNSQKLMIYREKAEAYFETVAPVNMKKSARRTQVRTECFFGHCLYDIQIRGQGQKTEHMRDVQGLSRLLSCSFFWPALFALIQFIFSSGRSEKTVICFAIYTAAAVLFCLKYRIDARNRVRMILGIYDACTDQEKKNV